MYMFFTALPGCFPGVKRELLDTVKARKLAYYGHIMRKQGNCLEKEIMQGTMPGVRRPGRPRTAWIDNIKSWTVSHGQVIYDISVYEPSIYETD